MRKVSRYVADFEATNDPETNHVWSWESLEIGDTEHPNRGLDIYSFIEWVKKTARVVYFHNLKYDISYIMSELFKCSYEWKPREELARKTFTSLISDTGIFYSVTVMFEDGTKVEFYDSYKLISMSVHDIALAYGLPVTKGEIDYNKERPVGYIPTEEEWDYQHRDVVIMSLALDILFKEGFKKMTQSSNALNDMRETLGKKQFKYMFPLLDKEVDEFCRKAYYGGASLVNPLFKGKTVGRGRVYDVNSEYPWAMSEKMLPFSRPVWFDGEYKKDEEYPLFIVRIKTMFHVKQDFLPTIQAKHVPRFKADKFLTSSHGRIVELTLTSVDLALFKDHYNIEYIEYLGGYKFMASDTLTRKYVDKWYDVKEQATIDGNSGKRTIAKDMLNKPSGKFGTKPNVASKIPYYDGRIKYKLSEIEERDSVYVPYICFVTAYGRDLCIRNAQRNYYRFLYMDTDSNHYLGDYDVEGLPVDNKKLGYFKHETTFSKARFLHAKCYLEQTLCTEKEKQKMIDKGTKKEEDFYINDFGELVYNKVTVAGLPANCHSQVNFDNFNIGVVYTGKLRPKMTPNGQILEECEFMIRDS